MYSLAVQTRDKLNHRFFYYRTRSKAEIDLILEGRFGVLINHSDDIYMLSENNIQIPANYL